MVGVMVRMKLAILRHGSGGRRAVGGVVGLALAIATLRTAAFAPLPAAAGLLAALVAAWTLGWVLGPSGSGGGDQSLKPEYFALEAFPVRRITAGLLVSAFVGVTAPVTALALVSLVLLGARFGAVAALVAVVAVPAQLLLTVLASRVVTALSSAALRTRLGIEVTALQNAAVLAAGFSVFMLYQAVSQYSDVLGSLWNEGFADPWRSVLFALPSGWGVWAVTAAGEGNALLALGLLSALGLSSMGLLAVWIRLVHTRVTSPTTAPGRVGGGLTRYAVRVLPSGPFGAVVAREMRTWGQDPRRALELRIALWTGVLVCGLGLLVGLTFMVPLAGLVTLALGALMSLNVYALDGTALWQTLLTPGAERRDVRGRQLVWLLLFVPVAVVLSAGGALVTGQDWAWPWVAALLPALAGAGAGFSVLFAVTWPAPGPEPHRHGGDALESGDVVGQFTLLFPVLLVSCVPPAAVTAIGVFGNLPGVMWAGAALGAVEGLLFWWLLGRVAYRRLERRGPELLTTLRWGWDATAGQSVAEQVEHGGPDREDGGDGDGPEEHGAVIARVARNLETMPRRTGALMTVLGLAFWLPLYQGAMSLIALATGAVGRSWHLPLYLPEALRMPGAVFALVLGAAMAAALVGLLLRRPRDDGGGVRSPEPGPGAERPGARPTTGS